MGFGKRNPRLDWGEWGFYFTALFQYGNARSKISQRAIMPIWSRFARPFLQRRPLGCDRLLKTPRPALPRPESAVPRLFCVNHWHEAIVDPRIADAVLDRLCREALAYRRAGGW
jgi:hypothetical protein